MKEADDRRASHPAPTSLERPAWISAVHLARGPRYQAIVEAIQAGLSSGSLRTGDRLPPQRELARMVGCNLGTVTRAFEELNKTGVIRGEVGRGTFLVRPSDADGPSSLWKPSQPLGFVDLSHNFPPDVSAHPARAAILAELKPSENLARLLAVQSDCGLLEHRVAAAAWLAEAGLDATPDTLVLTCGAQHGLLLALGALTRPGETVLTEELTFYGLKSAATMLGRPMLGVRMDDQGLVPASLDAACQRSGAKVLFCCPTLHNPTTATMNVERRHAIVEICRRHDLVIVEDDVYGLMLDAPLPPLASIAPDRTVYVTGVSKILGPGLRVGFVSTPARLTDAFGVALRATTLMASPLNTEAALRVLASSAMPSIIGAVRDETRRRHAIVAACLPSSAYEIGAGSFFFAMRTGGDWTSSAFARAAEDIGVGVTPFDLFEPTLRMAEPMVRVCHNAAPDHAHLRGALTALASLRESARSDRRSLRTRPRRFDGDGETLPT